MKAGVYFLQIRKVGHRKTFMSRSPTGSFSVQMLVVSDHSERENRHLL